MRMKAGLVIFSLLFIGIYKSFSQSNEWVWVNGSTALNAAPAYGTKGVPSFTNTPGGRYEAMEWKDLAGNFWLFGGASNRGSNRNNDLWKYDPTANTWTWMRGSDVAGSPGNYGTMGVADANNDPPARCVGLTWTDQNGFLWLYGGFPQAGNDYNDLWKYNIATNEWTWVMGNPPSGQDANFGNIGVPGPANHPGKRDESSCTWVDENNNLWLFGGDAASNNSMWRYNISTNEWTWMHGPSTTQAGAYGTKGVAAAGNYPGGRWAFSSWTDNAGDFWLFGGNGRDKNNVAGALNDLWKYNVATNSWTWVSGSDLVNDTGSYGTQCVYNITNMPPARYENRARWTDECGNFWMFGARPKTTFTSFHNDLWRYVSDPASPNTGNWVWVSGSTLLGQASVFGVQGIASPANIPGERLGAVGWYGNNSLWLFGGANTSQGGSQINDLWRYFPDTVRASFTPTPPSGCIPLTVNFSNQSTSGCNEIKSYYWDFGDPSSGPNNTSTAISPSHTFITVGNYDVKLVVSNCTGDKDSTIQTIVAAQEPILAVTNDTAICLGNTVTLTASGGLTYEWSPAAGLSSTTGNTVNLTPATNSTVTVITSNGGLCNDTGFVTVSTISPGLIVAGSTTIFAGNSTTLSASGSGSYYSWTPSQGLSCITCTHPIASPTVTTTYYVISTDEDGCTSIDSVTVTVDIKCKEVKVPNAFSPNNDGQNDILFIYGENCIRDFHFLIFDRWGEKVFETNDISVGWDGTYKNQPMDAAVFTFVVKIITLQNEDLILNGNITLIR